MAWRDQLRKATFRGVEFLTDSADGEFGRRTVAHEYPLRDKPYVEDLGRKARVITLEAYVLATAANGLNYMTGRDALIAAIEEAGPGPLVHPYLGEMRVSITGSKLRETTAEGGMARFTLTFTEAGEVTFPTGQVNTPSIVNAKADAAELAIVEDFEEKFTVQGLPDFVSNAAQDLLGSVSGVVSGLPQLVTVDPAALAEFLPGVEAFTGDLENLVTLPGELAGTLFGTIGQLQDLVDPQALLGDLVDALPGADLFRRQASVLTMLRKLFDFGEPSSPHPAPSVPTSTPSRRQQSQNQTAIVGLVQSAAVVTAARAASGMDFVAFQDATRVRDEIADRLDALMEGTSSDEVYDKLGALRSAVVKDISARGADLARVVSYRPDGTVPALVLAYDLYEDSARDDEIVTRNSVRHPGFVPADRDLQVLADA